MTINPKERNTWRSDVRSSMYAASQLSGGSPTDVDGAPAPACYLGDNCIQSDYRRIYGRKFSFTAMRERSRKT